MKRLPYIAASLVAMAAGCTEDCTENRNALPLAGFYGSGSPAENVTVDSLEVYGIGAPSDSVLFDGGEAVGSLYLPFRIDSDTTAYVFRPVNRAAVAAGVTDTVRFVYDRIPRLVSAECGASYVFRMRGIYCSTQFIDSVTCPGGEIDNTDTENIHIYFRQNEAGPES